MRTQLALVAMLVLTLVGCSSLPSPQGSQGVLLVGMDSKLENYDRYYVSYRLYLNDGRYFTVSPGKPYALMANLVPGKYTIVSIEQIYINTNRRFSNTRIVVGFDIEPNKITVLKKQIRVRFVLDAADKQYKQHFDVVSVSDSDRENLVQALSRESNANLWSIADAQ